MGNNRLHLITVSLQPLGLIWHLTSLHRSLLSETSSSLGDCALALDYFHSTSVTFPFILSCLNTERYFPRFPPLVSPLGISPSTLATIIRSCHTHNLLLHPLCFIKPFNAFALTENEIRFFSKADKDACALTAASLYVSFPSLLACPCHAGDKPTGIYISEHTKLSPMWGHLHLLFVSLGKIFHFLLAT